MRYPNFFDVKNSLSLFGLKKEFIFLSSLYKKNNLPKVLLLTGNKGSGKTTLVNHLLFSIFDEKNYDKENNTIKKDSLFYNQFKNDIFPNIIHINASDFKAVKVEDIKNLKKKIFQTSILNKDRFIILDDVELFNKNCLNALLKMIEEPGEKNYFFLINNLSKPLLETIKSRSLEIKIILNEINRVNIIDDLISYNKLNITLDPKNVNLSPGNFIKYDYLCSEKNINLSDDFIKNFSELLNLYKKNKEVIFINIAFFITDNYFKNIIHKKVVDNAKIYEIRNFIYENLNNLLLYNLNQNSLINAVYNKLKYE